MGDNFISESFEKELNAKISEIFNKEGEADTKLAEILASAKDAVNSELNALKITKEEIKTEKDAIKAKYTVLDGEYKKLKDENEKLNEQIKNANPDEYKKIYEQKAKDAAVLYESKINELTKDRDTYKQKADEAEKVQLKLECMQEFNKAIEGKGISTDSISDFADYVLGIDCVKFSRKSMGDGDSILANKAGRTIEQSVKDALDTSFGKKCTVIQSSGGGAEGGSYAGKPNIAGNPFITGNVTEISRLKRADESKFNRLKQEAIAAGYKVIF